MPGDDHHRQHQRQRRMFPTTWHLLCFAIIAYLAFTGHVSLQTLAIILISTLYLILLSTISFPPKPPPPNAGPMFPATWTKILPHYARLTGLVGLLLPSAYILYSTHLANDVAHHGVSAAAPHLFLLAVQVAMEGVGFVAGLSGPVWAFIPVFYNSWRMPALLHWARTEMMMMTSEADGGGSNDHVRLCDCFGRGLALVNVVLWSFNLFGFLFPVFLPCALKRYYASNNDATTVSKDE